MTEIVVNGESPTTKFFGHQDHKKNLSGEAVGFVSVVVEVKTGPGGISL
jgi:hypothetical protein